MDGHSQYDISLIVFKILYQYLLRAVCADSFQNLCRAHCFYIFNLPPVSALYYSRKNTGYEDQKRRYERFFHFMGGFFCATECLD